MVKKVKYIDIDEIAYKHSYNETRKIETLDDIDFNMFFIDVLKLMGLEHILVDITQVKINKEGLNNFIYITTNKKISESSKHYTDNLFVTVYQSQQYYEYFKYVNLEELYDNNYVNIN